MIEGAEAEQVEGLPIVTIELIRRDIFDTTREETSSWPYRWANAIHVVSKESFIRSMLLFEEGDPFSFEIAEETARILRALGFINPVLITVREVVGGVAVTVDTHDQWTLEVGAKFGLFGKRSDYGFDFTEENLLGHGWGFTIKYDSEEERDRWTYALYDPNILGTRLRARIQHEEATDGKRSLLRLEYPFYSLRTPRAWSLEWEDRRYEDHLYSASESVVQGTAWEERLNLWWGLRIPGERVLTRRLLVGYDYLATEYADWTWEDGNRPFTPPEELEISGVRVGFEQVSDRWVVLSGFRAWRSQEDVPLGPNFSAAATFSHPALGADRGRVLVEAAAEAAWPLDGWLILGSAWANGRFDGGQLNNAVVGAELAASQLGVSSWQARLRVEDGTRLDANRQLPLGADTGLRGWDPDFFDGCGRAVANLQWKTRLKENVLQLFTLGMVVFADAGYTWDARVGPGMDRVHGNVGVGLIADVTEVGLVKLLRVELALPDDGSGYTVSLTTRHLF